MRSLRLTLVLSTSLIPSLSFAGSLSYSYSGTVDLVFRTPTAPFSTVQVGDPIEVTYTLDLDTPDQDSILDAGTFSGAVITYEIKIGDGSATTEFGGVNTVNANALASEDTYAAVGLFEEFSASVSFQDSTGTALSPDQGLSTIDLHAFDDPSFLLLNGAFPAISGTLQPSVPEPASFRMVALLTAIGAGVLRRPRMP